MSQKPLIFIIAGEASGDHLGAELMSDLQPLGAEFKGIGGEEMQAQGLTSLFPMKELSIIGITGILKDLPNLLRRLRLTVETIQKLQPDIVITIDAPEFSFRVMKRLHKDARRPHLIHYVAPSVWAWRPWLAKKISRFLDGLLCLYPFEPLFFEKHGLKTTFVGHPSARLNTSLKNVKRDPNLLCVLPGSRSAEVKSLLPIFRDTVSQLKTNLPDLRVIIPTVPNVEHYVREETKTWPVQVTVVEGEMERDKAFQQAYAALAASGTVSLQLAAHKIPFVIAYKVSKFNEWVGRILIKTPWVCMVNIILSFQKFGYIKKDEKPWIPEFLQDECTPNKISTSLIELMTNDEIRSQQIDAMENASHCLKAPRQLAAQKVTEYLVKKK